MTQTNQNDRPFYVLRLSHTAEAKACFTSVCGGGIASGATEIGLMQFGLIANAPHVFGLFVFLNVMSATYNHLENRAMKAGQFELVQKTAPRITV